MNRVHCIPETKPISETDIYAYEIPASDRETRATQKSLIKTTGCAARPGRSAQGTGRFGSVAGSAPGVSGHEHGMPRAGDGGHDRHTRSLTCQHKQTVQLREATTCTS